MNKIKEILDGIKNSVFVKESVENIAAERYNICKSCPQNSKNSDNTYLRPDEFCTECECNLYLKVRSMHTKCPMDKWPSLATEDESELIDKAIENDNSNT